MPIVNIEGVGQVNFPDSMSSEDISDAIQRDIIPQYPDLAIEQGRTMGEAVSDIGAGLLTGIGRLTQLPGQVQGLVTGEVAPEEGLEGIGKKLEAYGQESRSANLKAKEARRDKNINKSEGFWGQFGTSIVETLKDPALITSFVSEQVPNLFGIGLGGAVTKQGVKLLMRQATEEVVAKAGTRGAIGTGAIMQGADIGTDTYERIYNERIAQGLPEDQAKQDALLGGRIAAVEAAALTAATSFGAGSTVERALTRGMAGAPKTGIIKGTLGETLSEAVEEGGGRLASNIEFQRVKPEADILEGVGAAAGQGAVGGALFGLPASFSNKANANQLEQANKIVEEAKRKAEENNQPEEIELPEDPSDPNSGMKVFYVSPTGQVGESFEDIQTDTYRQQAEETQKKAAETFSADVIKSFGISPKAGLYRNEEILNADITQPEQAAKVKSELEKYLSKYPNVSPSIRQNVTDYLARPEFQPAPVEPTQITEASITPEADKAAVEQRISEGFQSRPEIKKIYDEYNKALAAQDADKSALSAFNSFVTPEVIKSFGVPKNSPIFGDQELINADLTNPDTADQIRAKLEAIKGKTKSARIKENIDKYLNRSEFITPSYVESYLNPPREENEQGLDHFVFTDSDGNIQSKYGTVYEKNGKKYAKYAGNKSQKGGERELSENVLVNPNPDQMDLLALYKAKEKLMKEPDDFKAWLMGKGIKPGERADIGLETRIPSKMFRNDGFALDDLVNMAIEDGILHEPDFQEGIGGVESMREYIRRALADEFVPTMNNTRNMMDIENIQSRIDYTEDSLKGAPEEVIAEQLASDNEPEIPDSRKEIPSTPYTDQFIKDSERLVKDVRSALDKMGLKDVGVKFEDALSRRIDGKMTRINGEYFDNLIQLSLSGDNIIRTMNHEALHAMKDLGLFSPKEWKTLEDKARSEWMKKYKIADSYSNESEEIQLEEAIAHAFADIQTQPGAVKSIMSRVVNFLKRLGNWLRGNGYTTAEDIFSKASEGKLKGSGVRSKSTPKASVSTKTENFDRWFKGSKVVDENGNPKVMYHGTYDDFSVPKTSFGEDEYYKFGIHVGTPEQASKRIEDLNKPGTFSRVNNKEPSVMPLYVQAKNPLRLDEDRVGRWGVEDIMRAVMEAADKGEISGISQEAIDSYFNDTFDIESEMGVKPLPGESDYNPEEQERFWNDSYGWEQGEKSKYLKSFLNQLGYDSIVYDNKYEGGGDSYILFNPSQVKSATGNTGQFDSKNPDIRYEKKARQERMKASFEGVDEAYAEAIRKQFTQEEATVKEKFENLKDNFFEKMVTGLFDEFRAIKKYSTEGYMMARMSKSIDGGLQGLLEHGQVYIKDGALDIRPGTKGLMEILEPLGTEVDQYQIWKALSRDAQMPADKRSFTEQLIRGRNDLTNGTINGKSRKEIYEKARSEENLLNKSVLDVALESGLIDKQSYQVFSNDINYIPFYKVMDGGDVNSINDSAKLTGQYFSKALKGGEKKTNDLMENVLLNWSHILSASMKNQAAFKTIKDAEAMKAAEKAKPMDGKYPKDTVKVMEEGKTVHYTLSDPDLVDAISTISYLGPKSAFLDIARGFTNALRYGVTMSPAYKVRNLIRDSMQSASVSELGPNMFENVYNGLRMSKKGDPTFMSALAGGGIFEMGTAHEGDQAKLIKRLIDKSVKEGTILDTPEKIKANLQNLLDKYNELGNKFENANRLALYKKLRDSGKSHLEASYAARDLMDFSMQGQFRAVKIVGSVVPFFNARLQGLYKLGRDGITPTYRVIANATTGAELKLGDKEKAQRFATMAAAVSLASIALYGIYKDDEDFKRREDWDRDNFWWFKIGDTAFRIPKPFELGAIGTIAERTYEQIADDSVEGKVFGERLNHIITETFAINPMPQMFKPLIDLYANKDSFTGAPIESGGMERLSKQERVNNNTSGIAKALGGITEGASKILTFNPDAEGFSPVQIDYAIKSYFGWLGATAVSTADLAVEPFTEGTRVRKPIIDTLAMGFIKTEPQTQSKYMTQFYQNNARLQSALADMRHYAELGDSEKVTKIMEDKGNDIGLAKVYDRTTKQMAALRKQMRAIEQSKDIPTDDKRAQMNRLRILMSNMAEQLEGIRKSRQ